MIPSDPSGLLDDYFSSHIKYRSTMKKLKNCTNCLINSYDFSYMKSYYKEYNYIIDAEIFLYSF